MGPNTGGLLQALLQLLSAGTVVAMTVAEQDPEVTDEELTALALAADPDAVADDDAVPLHQITGGPALLPDWYMPAPVAGGRLQQGWRRRVAILIIVAFIAIAASGLCSTYGALVVA